VPLRPPVILLKVTGDRPGFSSWEVGV
jgi:hypothetical protein